jgi:Transposase IS4
VIVLGLVGKDDFGDLAMLAFVWHDRERHYFIASGSSMAEGTPQTRDHWRQVEKDKFSLLVKQTISVPQPKATEIYYSTCGKIDQHNRDRQATLGLERQIKTHDWASRVNMSILSMCILTLGKFGVKCQ